MVRIITGYIGGWQDGGDGAGRYDVKLDHLQLGPEITDQYSLRVRGIFLGTFYAGRALVGLDLSPETTENITVGWIVLTKILKLDNKIQHRMKKWM